MRTLDPGWIVEQAPVEIAEQLARLHGLCFASLPETPWSAHAFRTILRLPTTCAFVARVGEDAACGLLVGRLTGGEAEILTLCVAPGDRRAGVARQLFAAFARHVGGRTRILLEVAVGNAPAIALYESLGFRPVGRRPDYYAGRDRKVDALIYARGAPTP